MSNMQYYEVAPLKIIRAGSDSFTYASTVKYSIGQLVDIEVGKKNIVGLIISEVGKPSYLTKEIQNSLEYPPLPAHLVALSRWMAEYYHTPLAIVLQTVLPTGLTKKRRKINNDNTYHKRDRTNFVLNENQQRAVKIFDTMSSGSGLLHGITGSGKTAVYIELAKRTINRKQSVIILVPEIALTSQLVAELSHHFTNIIVAHSKQTEAQRHVSWQAALTSDTPLVIIGPRSALFLPIKNTGLIIIDECHEPSFKQEQAPRYSALRAASRLTALLSSRLIMGSATPSVSDYLLAQQAGRPIVTMNQSARPNTVKPVVDIIDMTKRTNFKKHRFISDSLLRSLEETFANDKQALIFHNRRGSASTTMCENCGWQAGCPRCYVPLTLHADQHILRCHLCGTASKVPTSCPTCHHVGVIHKGIGTKLIESELKKLFPDKNILRFDGDSTTDESLDKKYTELYSGDVDLIIGTQVVAKGLDLPNLRTVGVIQADAGLMLPDYTSAERTFQLLAQVIGRVGRSEHPTQVIVQSYQPTHPAVIDGISQNYQEFYERTLALRKHTHFPPYTHLLKLVCIYKTEATAASNARKFAQLLKSKTDDITILGPTPAFYERVRDTYRWQLVIKAQKRQILVDLLDFLPPTHWQYELDPASLL